MVGLVENALIEIRDKFRPDRIIIESRWVWVRAMGRAPKAHEVCFWPLEESDHSPATAKGVSLRSRPSFAALFASR